ncbi:sulfatase-like hydrolase/transferase [Pseudarthrobacter sp. AL07]|uniref:sulfatase-like hydrolase/transferase n=1 Tax=unclassified Pseudarthrobacter TaxID=2647000 RepID=UPI00249AD108|nr:MULTISPECIES: sulfatase-like hydrolase/transferase [unclassified Pseudarthrobacter]MDI3193862.1 sulfatase-like hydrolase/transferase [Pseudarthrobacter sp. AL20]MDI3207628.1 sulfatase-like hydrolase/transferase [Pseudarthrobacter sp. AL07]
MSDLSSGAPPHNILFLMTDQQRIDTLGCYGNTSGHTPVLDALAARGAVFERAYTPTAICTPARASLLTGLHPFEHGLLSNYEWNSGSREELPKGLPTFSAALAGQGYRLGHVGKWHVGRHRGPEHYGFEATHLAGALNTFDHPDYTAWLEAKGFPEFRISEPVYTTAPDGSQGHLIAAVTEQPTEATFEAWLADQTIEKLRDFARTREAGQPFFLSCHIFGPHLPYLIPRQWYEMVDPGTIELPGSFAETFAGKPTVQQSYAEYWSTDSFSPDEWRKLIAVYWGYVAMIDHEIGRILAVLEELGLAGTTAVAFTADHGEFTGAHRLNDKGPAMYEDIYRIPAVLALPEGTECRPREFVSLLDFTATFLDLAGAPTEGVRGRSLAPLARGEHPDDWRQDMLCEFHGHHFAYAQRMLRTDRYKLVVNPEGTDEVYDLLTDPDELNNVVRVPVYAEIVRGLRRNMYRQLVERGDRFAQWLAFMGDIPAEDRVRPETALERFVR